MGGLMKSREKHTHTMLTHTTQAHYSRILRGEKKKQALQKRTGALLMKMRNEHNWVSDIMGCWEYNITLVEL